MIVVYPCNDVNLQNTLRKIVLMKIVFFLLFLVFFQSIIAQEINKSSRQLSEKEIQEAATQSLENWNYYLRNDLDSLKSDAIHIMMIGFDGKNEFAINTGKRSLGSYLIRTGQQLKGVEYLKAANTYFEKRENFVVQTEILNEIGNGYLNNGKPIEAEKYYLKSLKCGKNSPDPTSAFLAEVNLAQAYINSGNDDKAEAILQHYKTESLKRKKFEAVSSAYALLGTIAENKKNVPLAKEYYRKSADFGFKSKATSLIAQAYNNMAIVFFKENELEKSLEYFQKALDLRLQTKNSKSISESYYNLGDYYNQSKVFDKAIEYFLICKDYSKNKKLVREELDAVFAISEVYKTQNKWEQAYQEMAKVVDLQKKYFSELAIEQSTDTELLQSLDQMEVDDKNELHEANLIAAIENEKYHTNILYAVFAFAIVALTFLVFYRKKIS
jgi:tetratricopeptide (TPR) repeat protein